MSKSLTCVKIVTFLVLSACSFIAGSAFLLLSVPGETNTAYESYRQTGKAVITVSDIPQHLGNGDVAVTVESTNIEELSGKSISLVNNKKAITNQLIEEELAENPLKSVTVVDTETQKTETINF